MQHATGRRLGRRRDPLALELRPDGPDDSVTHAGGVGLARPEGNADIFRRATLVVGASAVDAGIARRSRVQVGVDSPALAPPVALARKAALRVHTQPAHGTIGGHDARGNVAPAIASYEQTEEKK